MSNATIPSDNLDRSGRIPRNHMILKTYARVFTEDMDLSLALLQKLVGRDPDYRFKMPDLGLEIAGLDNFCVVAGPKEKIDPIRLSQGPLIVDDLEATQSLLIAAGAIITKPIAQAETGQYFYARHPDGSEIEYCQWKPELRRRLIG
jgi:hypothetical protein